jgi:hypothetical protein
VPQTTRATGSQWREIRGSTEGLKAEASTPPTTASEAMRPHRGTVGCPSQRSATASATSIGPTSHPAGSPARWAAKPASADPTPSASHPTASVVHELLAISTRKGTTGPKEAGRRPRLSLESVLRFQLGDPPEVTLVGGYQPHDGKGFRSPP